MSALASRGGSSWHVRRTSSRGRAMPGGRHEVRSLCCKIASATGCALVASARTAYTSRTAAAMVQQVRMLERGSRCSDDARSSAYAVREGGCPRVARSSSTYRCSGGAGPAGGRIVCDATGTRRLHASDQRVHPSRSTMRSRSCTSIGVCVRRRCTSRNESCASM